MKNLIMLFAAFTIFVIVVVAAVQVYLSKSSKYSHSSPAKTENSN